MDLVITAAGIGLILLGLYDIFRTLFLPAGKGTLSKWVNHAVWRGFQMLATLRLSVLVLAGPAAFLTAIITWVLLIVLGWSLIYWPRMPEAMTFVSVMDPSDNAGFLDAMYFSIVTVATLGYGDITPGETWLRLVAPLQAVVGFLLFTAAISWILSIYPDLNRRRAFAREVSLLHDAERGATIDVTTMDAIVVTQLLDKLTIGLVTVRGDMQQFPIIYYFHSLEDESSLSVVLPYILEIVQRSSREECPAEVRLHSARLAAAAGDLAETLATRFLSMSPGPADEVFAAYARDHLHHRE